MKYLGTSNLVVDVVITWVDGNDKKYLKKMQPYLKKNNKDINDKKFTTRFFQVDEIEIAVKSFIKFAPFVRTIFIVSDNQIPDFYRGNEKNFSKVKIIDHKDIFKGYETLLPTFNCLPIETMLHNISGLSEYFIYSNDDLFLLKTTKIKDFFIDGFPILRGKWNLFDENIWYKKNHQKIVKLFGGKTKDQVYGFKRGQQKIAKKLGFNRYYKFDHTPAPLRKSVIKKYFAENPDMEEINVKYRFRNAQQFTLQSLANHLEIQNKTCHLRENYQLLYYQSYRKSIKKIIKKLKKSSEITNDRLFLCMQSLDMCPPKKLNIILEWLKKNLT